LAINIWEQELNYITKTTVNTNSGSGGGMEETKARSGNLLIGKRSIDMKENTQIWEANYQSRSSTLLYRLNYTALTSGQPMKSLLYPVQTKMKHSTYWQRCLHGRSYGELGSWNK
jgi:hypothetical protein